MGWHNSKDVLKTSSSGGIFTALANYTFSKGGVVVGAAKQYGEWRVYHACAEHESELEPLKLSKYVQSDMGNTYVSVKSYLEKGRMVLFSGTACQVAGLQAFLRTSGTSMETLLTVDVLCHGVPSPKVVDGYVKAQEKHFSKKIADFSFRFKDEKRGWFNGGGTRMHVLFTDGTQFTGTNMYDTFFFGFNGNLFLRESCYTCRFCGTERVSDFTIADFWQCDDERIPREQMMLGVSIIVTNSEKAAMVLEALKEDITCYPIDPDDAIPYNLAFTKPQSRPEFRDQFYPLLEHKDYNEIIENHFFKHYQKYRVKKAIARFLPEAVSKKIFEKQEWDPIDLENDY